MLGNLVIICGRDLEIHSITISIGISLILMTLIALKNVTKMPII